MDPDPSNRTDVIRRVAELGVGAHRLSPPRTAPNITPRRRLLELLDASEAKVLTVTAGAGFGKSTLLSSWIPTTGRPFAWLQVEPSDNDPVRLLRSVLCAVAVGVSNPDLLDLAGELRTETLDRTLAMLEVADTGPFTLVLDDTHLLTDDLATGLLDQLIDSLGDDVRIMLTGRTDPPLRSARRRLDGRLGSIRATDLLLTPEEAEHVFAEVAGVEERTIIAERVGGWPAGAQFVLLGLRAGESPQAKADYEGLSTELTDYFQQEFLKALTTDDRDFLLNTSVLDRLSGELCDAVLDTSGSEARLDALVRSGNAFVIPAGDTGVYRYHPLFAEMLLAELRATAPHREAGLRQSAIEWFHARHDRTAVVEQALASRGLIDPAPWISRYTVPLIGSGELVTLERWLNACDPHELRTDAPLAITAAWHALYTDRRDEMDRWIAVAEGLTHPGPLPDGTVDVRTAVAAVRTVAGLDGVLGTAANARMVRDAGSGAGPWMGVAALLETVALQLSGIVSDTRPMFQQAEFETRGMPAAHAITLAHLCVDSLRRHDDARAADELRASLAEVRQHGLDEFRHVTVVYCAAALAEARAGRHEASREASQHAEGLLEGGRGLNDRAQIHFRVLLADAAMERGDWATMARLTHEAQSLLHLEPDARLLHEWVDRLARRSGAHTGHRPYRDLTAAEQRVLELLASHLTLGEIADRLFVSRNTVKTHTVSIYRKLYVSGRSEAIERANQLGLLDAGIQDHPVVVVR